MVSIFVMFVEDRYNRTLQLRHSQLFGGGMFMFVSLFVSQKKTHGLHDQPGAGLQLSFYWAVIVVR